MLAFCLLFLATGCTTATAIFQKLIYQLQNVVQGFKIWQNDRNTRTFLFVKLLGQPATPENVKDLTGDREIIMGNGDKHAEIVHNLPWRPLTTHLHPKNTAQPLPDAP